MKALLIFSVLPIFGLLFSTSVQAAGRFSHQEPIRFEGTFNPDGTVEIENVNGSISIRTWDRNDFLIEGAKRAKSADDLPRIEILTDLTTTHLSLKVKLPKKSGWGKGSIEGSVDLVITVPATARLENIRTVNGRLTFTDLQGPINASTVNGGIEASNLRGHARLHTVNGGVKASFLTLAPDTDLEFGSVNGSVRLAFPSNIDAELHASVVNGRLECELPLTITGRISAKQVNGTLGHGGGKISAETVNGSVEITRSDS